MRRIYEFSALIHVTVVVAASSEETARDELESWGYGAWIATGEAEDPTDIELSDTRDLPIPCDREHLLDLAHYVVDEKPERPLFPELNQ